MTPLESVLPLLLGALPAFWWMRRLIAREADPGYLRRNGVVIVAERALDAHSESIGEYLGQPIWGSVTFKGMRYRFAHVMDARLRERIAPGELFLDPGLVYRVE